VERRGTPNKKEYAKAPWWEKLVMEAENASSGTTREISQALAMSAGSLTT
jgi:hypothetical protein